MKKLLVTGVSGFLGWNICRVASREWEIFGTIFSHHVKIRDVNTIQVNLINFEEIKRLFQTIRPDAVIHTAAASDPNFCQMNRPESHKINVEASVNIAGLCADNEIPYAFTSTDLVFDGLKAPYRETDPVCPVNVYGEQKVLAEERIVQVYPMAAICRMPLLFGLSDPVEKSIRPMVKAMRKGEELRLFVDEFRTPVSAETAASGLFLALEKVTGIVHLGGIERVSRFDFAKLVAEIFEVDNAKLIPCHLTDIKMAAPRPSDVSLDSNKAFTLGFKPQALARALQEISRAI